MAAVDFSRYWKKSKKARKQVKYRSNAPLHLKRKLLGAPLSKELRENHNTRSVPVVKGDKVKIVRGNSKGKEGNVDLVNHNYTFINVSGVEITKKDGSKVQQKINPSNVIITELNEEDKKRKVGKNDKQSSKENSSK